MPTRTLVGDLAIVPGASFMLFALLVVSGLFSAIVVERALQCPDVGTSRSFGQ